MSFFIRRSIFLGAYTAIAGALNACGGGDNSTPSTMAASTSANQTQVAASTTSAATKPTKDKTTLTISPQNPYILTGGSTVTLTASIVRSGKSVSSSDVLWTSSVSALATADPNTGVVTTNTDNNESSVGWLTAATQITAQSSTYKVSATTNAYAVPPRVTVTATDLSTGTRLVAPGTPARFELHVYLPPNTPIPQWNGKFTLLDTSGNVVCETPYLTPTSANTANDELWGTCDGTLLTYDAYLRLTADAGLQNSISTTLIKFGFK